MFCKMCGAKLDDDSRFCSSCGAKLQSSAQGSSQNSAPNSAPRNQVKQTITQTIGGKLLGNFNDGDLQTANHYLKQHNFGKVFWNFSMAPGQVKGITFTGEIMENTLPYYFQMDMKCPSGAGFFGAWSTFASGWNADQALNEWVQQNPDKRLRASRVVTHGGVPTQLYILFTVKKQ